MYFFLTFYKTTLIRHNTVLIRAVNSLCLFVHFFVSLCDRAGTGRSASYLRLRSEHDSWSGQRYDVHICFAACDNVSKHHHVSARHFSSRLHSIRWRRQYAQVHRVPRRCLHPSVPQTSYIGFVSTMYRAREPYQLCDWQIKIYILPYQYFSTAYCKPTA